jgi:hypothetical protein
MGPAEGTGLPSVRGEQGFYDGPEVVKAGAGIGSQRTVVADPVPHVALFVPLQAGSAEQRGQEQQRHLSAAQGRRLGRGVGGEGVRAVGVEQAMCRIYAERAAEDCGFGFVACVQPRIWLRRAMAPRP